jgi:hypothetical protein
LNIFASPSTTIPWLALLPKLIHVARSVITQAPSAVPVSSVAPMPELVSWYQPPEAEATSTLVLCSNIGRM